MIIFLYGTDTYRSSAYLRQMRDKFHAERDPQGLNSIFRDCLTTKENLLQDLLAPPFLAEKKMVILEHLLISKHTAVQEALLERLTAKTLPSDLVLILKEGGQKPKTKRGKALFSRLQQEPFVQEFEELTGAKRIGWVRAELQSQGAQIAPGAATLLATRCRSMWQLARTMEQLAAYCYGREITEADVSLFVEAHVDDNIFALVDAIVHKQTKKALQLLAEQYRQGKDASYVFAMVVRQYRILLQLRDLLERGGAQDSTSLAKVMGMHPYVITKSLPIAQQHALPALRGMYHDLLQIDINTKTGQESQRILLELFVARAR